MPFDETYRRQAALLLRVIPLIAPETCFALKGGTAINLFLRDMPRLSVNIDLAYLPVAGWEGSLADIDAALRRIAARIESGLPGARVHRGTLHGEEKVNKLIVRAESVQIKIEVTPVLRGCVYAAEVKQVAPRVEELFGFAEMQLVSFPDLYGGKIVAALDHQHPRDLFDVRDLLAGEGIDDGLRKAFIIYLISAGRPLAELLAPTRRDITEEYLRGFRGTTEYPVAAEELARAREELIEVMVGGMPPAHREFLVSFKRGAPEWALLGVPEAESLPAVRWRLQNLAKMDEAKRRAFLDRLIRVLRESN